MKNTNLFKVLSAFLSLAAIGLSAEAQSTSVIPQGLTCESTLTLPSGKTEKVPVFLGDHLMFGPIAAATLQAGGQSTTVPLESAGFVGMIFEELKTGLVLLSIEAKISRTVFEPTTKEEDTMARGLLVLSRTVPELSKTAFSVANLGGGAVLIECELK